MMLSSIIITLFLYCAVALSEKENVQKQLIASGRAIKKVIAEIEKEWKINEFPDFLTNSYIPKSSWALMRLRFERKVMQGLQSNTSEPFIVSFTGTSVTAGHESKYTEAFPSVIENTLKPIFSLVGVNFISRNLALGNNPCIPYTPCMKYFCGFDPDVVVWEQSFNCNLGTWVVEQFVRQAMTIPSKPIVVYSESATSTWRESECVNISSSSPVELNQREIDLYKRSRFIVASSDNKAINTVYKHISDFSDSYHQAGIQHFQFNINPKYKCHDPFIASWAKGGVLWHPKTIGHKYRAAIYSYFWLHIFEEAINNIMARSKSKSISEMMIITNQHLKRYEKPIPKITRASPFPDDLVCKTDYEPRIVREASLKNQVVSGLILQNPNPKTNKVVTFKDGWGFASFDEFISHGKYNKFRAKGYKDFKYLLHGNEDSGPLSIKFEMRSDGPVFICQTPGYIEVLPENFESLTQSNFEAYITYNVLNPVKFTFDKGKSTKAKVFKSKSQFGICVQIQDSPGKPSIAKGKHVLTLVQKGLKSIIVAWMLTS